ncbi:threonylcarbamoyladenosine tRNA methylthiotransferase isoform X1 [Strongylocentrotus purpuratus]|uniref:tRNA-t(6)A37 methylthiotransferase n=1 Tax=Strongylocentrotus purpuratus TaxID=7668 RepID=A0A7M7TH57_STRPU|nr:threonylcarbamoyladenosine tRNA methylthiotransferase isoform X1 [Strongylocentrotus purpuratus]
MPSASEIGIDDIEDIISAGDVTPKERYANKQDVMPKVLNRKKDRRKNGEDIKADSIIPGTQKVFVKTWGCSHNNSDGEYMAGQLASYGYSITDDSSGADVWLLNSCTVKNPAEDHFRNEIQKAQQQGKALVLAGCVPQGQPKAKYMQGVSVIGVQQIDRVVEVVEETVKGNTVRLFGQKKQGGKKIGGASLDLPKIRRNPLVEILAINTGCLNQCTYCKTKHARGELGSYPPEELVARAKQSFDEGVCEIWLTSEDTGAYGIDIGVTIVELLDQLVEVIPEGCMMRIGMTNPPYILDHLEGIARILRHPRVYSFLHIPIQSGSDSVLMDMKREYCTADFRKIVEFLRKEVPRVTIATDIICGFPHESEKDFEETLSLIEEFKFPSVFINQYFPRPGTPAAKWPQVPAQEKKRRTKALTVLFKSYQTYDDKVGERFDVLVTEVSHDKQYLVAHNKFYDQVLVPHNKEYLGRILKVEIDSVGKHFLMGRVLDVGPARSIPVQNQQAGSIHRASAKKLSSRESSSPIKAPLPWVSIIMAVLIAVAFLDVCRIAYQHLTR